MKQVKQKMASVNATVQEEHLQKKRQDHSSAEDALADAVFVKEASPAAHSPGGGLPGSGSSGGGTGGGDSSAQAPSSVHETLRRPGEPLTAEARAFFEPRFGHDFGKVRVHADAQAAKSAEDVQAKAYTVGSDIVFNAGNFRPASPEGRRLIAHELTHVMQQSGVARQGSVVQQGGMLRQGGAAGGLLMRQVKASEFPGFSQANYNSCGAASLVSALLIWDKERNDPNSPNTILITACNTILVYLVYHANELIKKLDKESLGGRTGNGQSLYDGCVASVTKVRDAAKAPGGQLTQALYEELGAALYVIYKSSDQVGMEPFNIEKLEASLGLSTVKKPQPGQPEDKSREGQTFDQLMDKLSGLQPGQAAQVSWYARTGAVQPDGKFPYSRHVFLVGLFKQGKDPWYLSDQGTTPPTELKAANLPDLKNAIRNDTNSKGKGIEIGGIPVKIPQGIMDSQPNPPGTVLILGDRRELDTQARNAVITPGAFLVEVDASWRHDGDRIMAWDLVDRTYTLNDARKALDSAGTLSGGVIVEIPQGLFHVYKTNLVSDINVNETKIDERDSADGLILPSRRRFFSAYLQLRSTTTKGSFFKVY